MKTLMKTVEETIATHEMLVGGETVLIGVSGGPDSLVLLHILSRLAPAYALQLHVFHLNHLMRGAAAEADAAFVARTAEQLGLPATVLSSDVPAYIKANNVSPEDGARQVRRELLRQVADEIGADRIALGHNADDRVETFLMRLLRGAGLDGLRSIPPVNGQIIRPLSDVWRADIEAYCLKAGLQPRTDETNLELDITRNKVRHELLKLLEAEYNPNIRAELRREMSSIDEDAALLSDLAHQAFTAAAERDKALIRLDRNALAALPVALQRRLIRLAALELAGDPQPLGFAHVADILAKVMEGKSGAVLDLPGGLSAAREYDTIVIKVSAPESAADKPVGSETVLSVPGVTTLPGTPYSVDARFADPSEFNKDAGPDVAWLDASLMQDTITARQRRPGDRIQPLGMRGRKKLSDLFIDEKTARDRRILEPVIETGGQIAWVASHRIDERFKVTAATKKILVLRLVRGSR